MFAARNMVFAGVASYDADAATYFAAIATAGSSITTANKDAVNAFIVGCKADSIWTAIKASCLLAGPDDLTGALVPLVGSAPTNTNFVSGDYSRTLGLTGNGSTKYLNSNRAATADPQNDVHIAVWATTLETTNNRYYIGASASGVTGATGIRRSSATAVIFQNRLASPGATASTHAIGFIGTSRTASNAYDVRGNGTTSSFTTASQTTTSDNYGIFATINSGSPASYGNGAISFYSIGENLNLSLLDARLATYMAALT